LLDDGRILIQVWIRIRTYNEGSGSGRYKNIRIHNTGFNSGDSVDLGTRISQESQFLSLEVAPPLTLALLENMDKDSNCHEKSRKVLRKGERKAAIIAFLVHAYVLRQQNDNNKVW
jgi:hypothetical protein